MKKAIIDLRPWIVPILLLIIWEVVARLNLVSASLFPSPISIIVKGWELTISGELATHVWASLGRALAGMLIGGTIGFVLGIVNGLSDRSYVYLDSTIQMIRNIPHLALIPLVIVWLGIGESAKIFLVTLGVLFPV